MKVMQLCAGIIICCFIAVSSQAAGGRNTFGGSLPTSNVNKLQHKVHHNVHHQKAPVMKNSTKQK